MKFKFWGSNSEKGKITADEVIKTTADTKEYLHLLEIYPPSEYDPDHTLKKPDIIDESFTSPVKVCRDLLFMDENYDKKTDVEERNVEEKLELQESIIPIVEDPDKIKLKESMDEFTLLLPKIVQYIKYEWIEEAAIPIKHPLLHKEEIEEQAPVTYFNPFGVYSEWPNMEIDMKALSGKFPTCVFVVYIQHKFYIDNIRLKIYHDGELDHSSNKVKVSVQVKLPNGVYTSTEKGVLQLNPHYDVQSLFRPATRGARSLSDYAFIATDLTMAIGNTVAQVGSLVPQAATAATLLSSALQIVKLLEDDLVNYRYNRGKCLFVKIRCQNIVETLQQLPPDLLNIQQVKLIVDNIQEAQTLVNTYIRKWRITKFFGSAVYRRQFDNLNAGLDICYNDLGIKLTIDNTVRSLQN